MKPNTEKKYLSTAMIIAFTVFSMVLILSSCEKSDTEGQAEVKIVEIEKKPQIVYDAPPAPAGSIVAKYGRLKVIGTNLCDQNGNPIQLRGMSLFWSQWSQEFWNADVVNALVDDWKCTIIRASLGIASGGYIEDPETNMALLKTVLDAAIAKGVYVIIDWHDHNALLHEDWSKKFFEQMTVEYGKYPNVLFETFNEPDDKAIWTEVRVYHENIIKAVRAYGCDTVIIAGTTSWAKDVEIAADFPIRDATNIMYSFHFYAASHRSMERQRAEYGIKKGLPLIVSEFGTVRSNGDGDPDFEESDRWMEFMDTNRLSWCNWSVFNKMETASILTADAEPNGKWKAKDLTASGKYIKAKIAAGVR